MRECLLWFTYNGAFEQENFLVLKSFRMLLWWFLKNAKRCADIRIAYR